MYCYLFLSIQIQFGKLSFFILTKTRNRTIKTKMKSKYLFVSFFFNALQCWFGKFKYIFVKGSVLKLIQTSLTVEGMELLIRQKVSRWFRCQSSILKKFENSFRGAVSKGSIGSDEPINFQRLVLEPTIF